MATQVEAAESKAKRALVRLATAVESGVAFAFTPDECAAIVNLIDALRDNQALDAQSSPFERTCPACKGEPSDADDPCDGCGGVGLVPTKIGQKILNMIGRHFVTPDDLDTWAPTEAPEGAES